MERGKRGWPSEDASRSNQTRYRELGSDRRCQTSVAGFGERRGRILRYAVEPNCRCAGAVPRSLGAHSRTAYGLGVFFGTGDAQSVSNEQPTAFLNASDR